MQPLPSIWYLSKSHIWTISFNGCLNLLLTQLKRHKLNESSITKVSSDLLFINLANRSNKKWQLCESYVKYCVLFFFFVFFKRVLPRKNKTRYGGKYRHWCAVPGKQMKWDGKLKNKMWIWFSLKFECIRLCHSKFIQTPFLGKLTAIPHTRNPV